MKSIFTPFHTMAEDEDPSLTPMSQYSSRDRSFSVPAVQSRVSNLCIQLMFGLCDGDMEPLKPYVTDSLFNHFKTMADQWKQSGNTLHIERPAVLRTEILGFRVLPNEDHIHVRCQIRAIQYVTDCRGRLVSGDRSKEVFVSAVWVFARETGKITQRESGLVSVQCPSCGVPINVYDSARCPHCGALTPVKLFNWMACAILNLQ